MRTKGKSDKKGISLIVLVITIIVIIILAVAVILSIANNNPIENAKEARFKNDVKTMQEELELLKASNYAKNNGASYNDPDTGEPIEIGDLKSATNYQEKFAVKDGELKYIAEKLTDEEKTWVSASGITEQIILKMGREIKYKNEPFYIIGGDEVGKEVTDATQDILLLAKYNLTSDGSSQDQNGNSNPCAFSSTTYWSSVEGIAYPDSTTKKYPDLNDETKYGTGSDVIAKAKAYGASLKATGRLMTYEEANVLETPNYSEILCGNKDGNKLNYWLGSAYSENGMWIVHGDHGGLASAPSVRQRLRRGPPSYKSLKVFGQISDFRSL